ncbi:MULTISPECIES: hypothetical protein [Halomonas]|uniref:Uncharacterized protein n=1 Tax=Halomonas flagellata TaxID=2920385 RepID=A0ABS9S051_9GAMM|nr:MULTISPECIES: hypothetical protein [Halomonas]MCH4565476.1 hypothetical protein [Halomonas flagellata]PXX99373.1 hypothetical protein CR157_00885 [Halomonas sp. LBP4]
MNNRRLGVLVGMRWEADTLGPLRWTDDLVWLVGTYVPLLRYYGLTVAWALTLLVAATLYLGMTWLSAWQYLRGTCARWRGRPYTA